MVSNKLRLCNQGDYYDREANCLIVPVCTLDEAKAWNGNGYKAIVMVDSKGGELSRMQQQTGMFWYSTEGANLLASGKEVETAR